MHPTQSKPGQYWMTDDTANLRFNEAGPDAPQTVRCYNMQELLEPSMFLTLLIETTGVLIVLFTLRDVFHDIFHPTKSGSLSDFIGKAGSKLFRHTRLRPAIGPASLVTVIFCWVGLITIGFALIYFPLIPTQLSPNAASWRMGDRVMQASTCRWVLWTRFRPSMSTPGRAG